MQGTLLTVKRPTMENIDLYHTQITLTCIFCNTLRYHIRFFYYDATSRGGFCPVVADQYLVVYMSTEPWTRQPFVGGNSGKKQPPSSVTVTLCRK